MLDYLESCESINHGFEEVYSRMGKSSENFRELLFRKSRKTVHLKCHFHCRNLSISMPGF